MSVEIESNLLVLINFRTNFVCFSNKLIELAFCNPKTLGVEFFAQLSNSMYLTCKCVDRPPGANHKKNKYTVQILAPKYGDMQNLEEIGWLGEWQS